MKEDYLISIIVPVYKVEDYLYECVKTIQGQTYTNLEIILVDDGSPDKSGELCDEYAKKDNRIKVIHKANGGLSSARNAGLSIAKGEYIGFVDSDDYIRENMYEKLLDACIRNKTKISACNYNYVVNGNEKKEQEEGKIEVLSAERFFEKLLVVGNRIEMVAWNKLYHRSIFEKNPSPFPEGKIYEDLATMYKFVFSTDQVSWIDEGLYLYRRFRDGAITSINYNFSNENDRLNFENSMASFIKEKAPGIYDKAVVFKCINGDLSVANCIAKSKVNDKTMVKRIKADLRTNYKYWIKSKIAVSKKIQLFLCMVSFEIYRYIIKAIK